MEAGIKDSKSELEVQIYSGLLSTSGDVLVSVSLKCQRSKIRR